MNCKYINFSLGVKVVFCKFMRNFKYKQEPENISFSRIGFGNGLNLPKVCLPIFAFWITPISHLFSIFYNFADHMPGTFTDW